MGRIFLAVGLLAFVPVSAPAAGMERWVTARGGFAEGAVVERVAGTLRAVAPAVEGTILRAHVLDAPELGAWTWPSGDVVVTRGLVAALDDDELAAVLAHEIGHLLADARLPAMAALAGPDRGGDDESAADASALHVLAAAGRPVAALARALRKVQSARGPAHPDFAPLAERIRRLEPAR